MATTRLITMHQNKGKTVARSIKDRINYAINSHKTEDGKHVSCYECDPKTAAGEFVLSHRVYEDATGRKPKNSILAYQIRHAFKPGEVTPEQANEIGYKLGMSFTKGKYAFVVATHIDKEHIHNHIIFNSVSLDNKKKFRNFFGSSFALRRISDQLSLEYGLSIIESPKVSRGSYGKWLGDKKETSHKEYIRKDIDNILAKNPINFDAFLEELIKKGYQIKQGKDISLKGTNQSRFRRLNKLGEGYTKEDILRRIEGKPLQSPRKKQKSVNLLIDIQEIILKQKGKGYENWAKVFNVKQMANTINFLREHDCFTYEELSQKATAVANEFRDINTSIKEYEKKLEENKTIRTHIFNYSKTRDIFFAYRKSGYSKKFYEEHEKEIILHKSAKDYFNTLETKTIPRIKELREEYSTLAAEKQVKYKEYKELKKVMKEILLVKENVDRILNINEEKKTKEKSQDTR